MDHEPAGIRDAYASGRGSLKVRARAHVEPLKGGKEAMIVTELPFMVKKGGDSGLITKIADLVREKKLEGSPTCAMSPTARGCGS